MAKMQILIDELNSHIDLLQAEIVKDESELSIMREKARILQIKKERAQHLYFAVSQIQNSIELESQLDASNVAPVDPWDFV